MKLNPPMVRDHHRATVLGNHEAFLSASGLGDFVKLPPALVRRSQGLALLKPEGYADAALSLEMPLFRNKIENRKGGGNGR